MLENIQKYISERVKPIDFRTLLKEADEDAAPIEDDGGFDDAGGGFDDAPMDDAGGFDEGPAEGGGEGGSGDTGDVPAGENEEEKIKWKEGNYFSSCMFGGERKNVYLCSNKLTPLPDRTARLG